MPILCGAGAHRLILSAVVVLALAACGTPTLTPTPTAIPTPTPTAIPTPTPTAIPTPTPTAIPTPTPTAIPTPIPTPRYRFPVEPADQSSYGRCHHDYPASDIFVPIGSAFIAVTDGVVDFVRDSDPWDPQADDPRVRGGIAVAIVGDDGVRYYGSHLTAVAPGIAVGVRVSAGDVLGTTGVSGNARGTPPHLHFGISPPGDNDDPEDWLVRRGTIDPWPFLEAWRVGRPLTPDITDTSGRGAC